MSKKKKKKRVQLKTPPLSALDKFLYVLGYILPFLICIAGIWGWFSVYNKIAFKNSDVLACSFGAGVFFVGISFFAALMIPLMYWASMRGNRKPLFGNKKIEYGKPPWKNIYPIFKRKSGLDPKRFWQFVIFELIALAVLAVNIPFSLFDRISITGDGNIHEYNIVNKETIVYPKEQIDECNIYIRMERGATRTVSYSWHYGVLLTTECGEDFDFYHFKPGDGFEAMLKIKEIAKSQNAEISFSGTEDLERFIDENAMDESDREMVCDLFDVQK